MIRSGESPDLESIYGTTETFLYQCNSEDRCASLRLPRSTTHRQLPIFEENDTGLGASYGRSSQVAATEPSTVVVSDLLNIPYSPSASVPPSILYNSLSQRFRPILDRCMLNLHLSAPAIAPLTNLRQQGVLQNPIDV